MNRNLKIQESSNGFILTWQEENEEDYEINEYQTVVIEDKRDDKNECIGELLYFVAEYFGVDYNKYGSDNLNIEFNKKGNKVEE